MLKAMRWVTIYGIFVGLLTLPLAGPCEAKTLSEGEYHITLDGDSISLEANAAPSLSVIRELASAAGIELKYTDAVDTPVTFSKQNVQLLDLIKTLAGNYAYMETLDKENNENKVSKKLYLMQRPGKWEDSANLSLQAASRRNEISVQNRASQRSPDARSPFSALGHKSKTARIERSPNELLVRFSPEATAEQIAALNEAHSATIVKTIGPLGIYRLRFPAGGDMSNVENEYRQSELTQTAEPNYLVNVPPVQVDDPGYGDQWGLRKMLVPEAWNVTTGTASVLVAILDTGVDDRHPDLAQRLTTGYDAFSGTSGSPNDDHGHGTQMAGIIAAEGNNGIGVSGVSWECRILPVKVLNADGVGTYMELIEGLLYAADHGAQVINMSLGGYGASKMLQDATQYAFDKGAILVAGVGNDGLDTPTYPAAHPHVLGVTATGPQDEQWEGANTGEYIDLAAPGIGILSTARGGGYSYGTGTSHAAAMASGVAALLKAAHADWTNSRIAELLQQSADDLGTKGRDDTFGAGRINALNALQEDLPR